MTKFQTNELSLKFVPWQVMVNEHLKSAFFSFFFFPFLFIFFYSMLFPKYVRSLFLNTWANSITSDSLIFLFLLSNWQFLLFFLHNLLVTSMVRLAISLLFVNTRKTVAEYNEWDASLLRRISTSRNSDALDNDICRTKLTSFQENIRGFDWGLDLDEK